MKASIITKKQTRTFKAEGFRMQGGHGSINVVVRYDDQCNNGHNSFSITGTLYRDGVTQSSGCIHDDIVEFMPELAHLVKWHLMQSDAPLHYIENTIYHTKDTDSSGLKKGEYGSYKLSVISDDVAVVPVTLYTSKTIYTNKQNNQNFDKIIEGEALEINGFINSLNVGYRIELTNLNYSLSEGKEPDLQAGRRSAIWPDATLEQLSSKDELNSRLPALVDEFKTVIESLGMVY